MEMKYPTETVEARHAIARAALDGDPRYSHEAIGADDGDINGMAAETGLPLVYRAESDSDVAVYSDGDRWAMVADANGPVVIRLATTTLMESTPPAQTPWGPATDRRWAGVDGLYAVTTASHGGYWVRDDVRATLAAAFPGFQPFAGWPWLEEDCDAQLVMALWPHLFPDHAVWSVWRMALSGATWCNAARAIREWLESTDAGLAWAQRCAAWGRAHAAYWIAGGAYGDASGWSVDWSRVDGSETVTVNHGEAYPGTRCVSPETMRDWLGAAAKMPGRREAF